MPSGASIAFRAAVEKNRTSPIRLQCSPLRICEQRRGGFGTMALPESARPTPCSPWSVSDIAVFLPPKGLAPGPKRR